MVMADDSEEETAGKLYKNQPYDESLEIPDAEEVASQFSPTPRVEINKDRMSMRHEVEMSDESDDNVMMPVPKAGSAQQQRASAGKQPKSLPMQDALTDDEEDEEEDDEDEDDDDDDDYHGKIDGLYNPADYEHLAVSPEVKELFQYISRYATQNIELEYRLLPFIPDFIPAVGDIDAFIKVPRHDGKADSLGLTVLDEPCAKQSDPHVLDLKLRSVTKQTTTKQMTVKTVDNLENNTKAIDSWIKSIADLHRTQPAPTVHYSKNMPEVDVLMQEWPTDVEEILREIQLSQLADLDCDLGQYIDVICGLLDIPVHKSRIQSLHLLFTLFSEFKNSQHFQAMAAQGSSYQSAALPEQEESDRLTL